MIDCQRLMYILYIYRFNAIKCGFHLSGKINMSAALLRPRQQLLERVGFDCVCAGTPFMSAFRFF